MTRTLSLLLLIACGAVPNLAEAKTGRCILEVNGRSYLQGPCEITIQDKQGSFSIGAGPTHRAKYFAYVNMDDDGAHGYWNETPDASHAHADLGMLKRDGACWKNSTARVCAFR